MHTIVAIWAETASRIGSSLVGRIEFPFILERRETINARLGYHVIGGRIVERTNHDAVTVEMLRAIGHPEHGSGDLPHRAGIGQHRCTDKQIEPMSVVAAIRNDVRVRGMAEECQASVRLDDARTCQIVFDGAVTPPLCSSQAEQIAGHI